MSGNGIDVIAQSLGVRPMSEAIEEASNDSEVVEVESEEIVVYDEPSTEVVPAKELGKEVIEDIEFAKDNIKNIIKKGTDAFEDLVALAKTSEQARAFESATLMMTELIKANKEFIEVSDRKRLAQEEIGGEKQPAQTNITNNNLIVSTNSLLDSLLDMTKRKGD